MSAGQCFIRMPPPNQKTQPCQPSQARPQTEENEKQKNKKRRGRRSLPVSSVPVITKEEHNKNRKLLFGFICRHQKWFDNNDLDNPIEQRALLLSPLPTGEAVAVRLEDFDRAMINLLNQHFFKNLRSKSTKILNYKVTL